MSGLYVKTEDVVNVLKEFGIAGELIIETLPQVGIFPIGCKTVVDSEYVCGMKEKERFEFEEYVKDNICSKMAHELKPFIHFKGKENGEFQYEVSAAFDLVLPLPYEGKEKK